MSADLIVAAFWVWLVAAALALVGRWRGLSRFLLGGGCACGIAAALTALPRSISPFDVGVDLAGQSIALHYDASALWLLGFGLAPAMLACWIGSPAHRSRRWWLFGAAGSLLGALGVFGLQDGVSFLVAWETMSLGGAVLILGERLGKGSGKAVLFMLALLEVGAIALLLAFLLLGARAGTMAFSGFASVIGRLDGLVLVTVGILVLIGFGAKLGLLPFYEWFPASYANASGATGVLLSGVVLNAAFYALGRAYIEWWSLPAASSAIFALGVIIVAVGVLSSILAILYAFQQDDWRSLLSFSSAENASIAVALLGVCIMFRNERLDDLAGLAWTVALIHLAAHALAKGALFLTADSVYRASGDYAIAQRGWLRQRGVLLGIGALFAAMSLAAIPPQAGFVSEWFVFQTVFQGFHLATFSGRLVLALAGAGLALTAAIALATFTKVFGLGLLGAPDQAPQRDSSASTFAVGVLGICVLALAVGMPVWLDALADTNHTLLNAESAHLMASGWLLVPLTSKFAFISPSLLVIVMPLLALIPILLLVLNRRPIRRVPVWYGGMPETPAAVTTTSLSYSSALRTFYSFIYRPILRTTREHEGVVYFTRRLVFDADVAPLFGPTLFQPATCFVQRLATRLRALQSGNLNFYLALIGALWVLILCLSFI